MTQEGKLTVVDPATLSTREFVVYQYGISILQFLRFHIDAPEINLCVASSIPLSNATGNAFRNSFFYQNSKNKLFVLRDCLSSVGSFLLLLVHCSAHIIAADFNHDANPLFLRLFFQNNLLLRTKFEEPQNDKLLVKKKQHFLHASSSYEKGSFRWRTSFEEETCAYLSPSELEDKVDVLTEELVHIIEDEHQFLNSKGNED